MPDMTALVREREQVHAEYVRQLADGREDRYRQALEYLRDNAVCMNQREIRDYAATVLARESSCTLASEMRP